jgi:hypothetical protein
MADDHIGRITMATSIGTAASETITPVFISAGVSRFPAGSFPGGLADVIFGGGGIDTIDGGGGNDALVGDAGNDTLRGNTGADVLIGGANIDTATYSESAAPVTVSLVTGAVGIGGTGNFRANVITGNSSASTLSCPFSRLLDATARSPVLPMLGMF